MAVSVLRCYNKNAVCKKPGLADIFACNPRMVKSNEANCAHYGLGVYAIGFCLTKCGSVTTA